MRIPFGAAAAVALAMLGAAGFAPASIITVPFVGCASDGQTGPLPPPTGKSVKVDLDPDAASRLAWYKGEMTPGVLGPRGWACFSTYGGNGASVYIAPELPSGEAILRPWRGIDGPGLQLTVSYGGTSGRFTVAGLIARYFPERIEFTKRVIAEGIEPQSDFPAGHLPGDRIKRVDADTIEFDTPREVEGQGAMSWLRVNNLPIIGVVKIVDRIEPNVAQLSVRVRPEMAGVVAPIIARFERGEG